MQTTKREQLRLQRSAIKFSKENQLIFSYLENILTLLYHIQNELNVMKQPNYQNPNRLNEMYNLASKGLIGNYKLPSRGGKGPLPKQGPPQTVIS